MNSIVFNSASSCENKTKINALRLGYSSPSSVDIIGKLLEEASLEIKDLIKKRNTRHTTNSFTFLKSGWTNFKK